jgi:MFS family permease
VLTGLASNFLMLFVTRMFTGVGEAGYEPAGKALVGDFFQDDQRGKVISWLSVGGVLGPILGMVLGGMIAGLAPGSWRFAFLITGIPGLILAFFAWRLREPVRHQTAALSHEAETTTTYEAWKPGAIIAQLRTLLRIKTFVCLLIFGVLTAFTATALQVYFPILLQQRDTFGLTSGQAAAFAGLALGPTALVGIVLGGYLADWLKRRYQGARILICALSVLLTIPLNIASLLLTSTHNLVLFSAFLIPAFFVNMLHIGPLGAAMLDVIPADQRASAVSISVFIQRILGTALAPLLIGMLASSFDPSGLHFLHSLAGHDLVLALLYTCPIAFILAGIVSILGLRWMHHDQETVA